MGCGLHDTALAHLITINMGYQGLRPTPPPQWRRGHNLELTDQWVFMQYRSVPIYNHLLYKVLTYNRSLRFRTVEYNAMYLVCTVIGDRPISLGSCTAVAIKVKG